MTSGTVEKERGMLRRWNEARMYAKYTDRTEKNRLKMKAILGLEGRDLNVRVVREKSGITKRARVYDDSCINVREWERKKYRKRRELTQ